MWFKDWVAIRCGALLPLVLAAFLLAPLPAGPVLCSPIPYSQGSDRLVGWATGVSLKITD